MVSNSAQLHDFIVRPLNSHQTGLAVCNSEGIISSVDSIFCSLLHQPADALIGKSISLFLKYVPLAAERAFSACKVINDTAAGEEKEPELSISVRWLNGAGSSLQLLTLRLSEKQESKSGLEQRVFAQLLSLLPDLLITVNRSGILTKYFNTANETFAVDPSHIVGFNVFSLLSSEEKASIIRAIDLCLHDKMQTTAEYTMPVTDSILHYEARFVAFGADEVLCVIRDITTSYQVSESRKSMLRILELLVAITGQLLRAPFELTQRMLTDAIGRIGRELKSPAILLYQFDDDNFSLSRSVEWLSVGIQSNPDKHSHLPVSLFDEWMPSLAGGVGLSLSLSPAMSSTHPARLLAECYNLSALEVIPLSDGKQCRGFIVFLYKQSPPGNDYKRAHLIRLFADLIGSFLIRQSQQEDLDTHHRRLASQNEELSKLNHLYQAQNESIGLAHEQMRKAKELAEASDRLKSNFLNLVTHEIRTPLNGILGFAQLMSMSDITEYEKTEYLQILNGSTDRLINTVNNLLQVSLVMSGNTTPHHIAFDLNEFFRILQQYTLSSLEHKSIAVYITVPEESRRLSITTDQKLLRQAFDQMISNAVKYTTEGFIEVGYSADEEYLRMWVKDTGMGIGENAHQTVFGAFNQENSTASRNFEGLGLGLSVAKGLIEVLGGQIELASKKNTGSTFTAIFPIDALKPSVNPTNSCLPDSFPVVVVGDADGDSYASLRLFLMNSGIETVMASNAGGFFRLCKKHQPNVMGMVHTGISGMPFNEIADTFHRLYPDRLFFAIDNNESDRLRTESREIHISGYLTKPIARFYVKSVIERSTTRLKSLTPG
ncbi:MAG TPA: hypothetical protein DCR43_06600 [Bacteroidales bacterium]|nr:MAG: hypothetical protein A2X11_16075 [Bacteroidetes bacterium GWE2_42_24]OFY29212.1 MAG: hypothetical protein A2X09_05765 [Bacteroidetes bacterium GWF2_43_11]HAQ65504.1 hypothetical protein [Bacteroidales bacterium]HBZ66806.1 hypothetical protein [Bacteroidales bacterium]